MTNPIRTKSNAATRQRGVTLTELLLVVALLGISAVMTAGVWQRYKRSTSLAATAQVFQRTVAQARLRAIYNNINHFIVLDMAGNSLTIVEDTGANVGVYEADDRVLTRQILESTVELSMPVGTLPHPLGSGTVTQAWTLPLPVSGTEWGDSVGLMCNPEGRLMSVAATPEVIGFGAVVFNDPHADAAVGVGVEGRSGTIRTYRLSNGAWSEM